VITDYLILTEKSGANIATFINEKSISSKEGLFEHKLCIKKAER
jgi:hypothetical protein